VPGGDQRIANSELPTPPGGPWPSTRPWSRQGPYPGRRRRDLGVREDSGQGQQRPRGPACPKGLPAGTRWLRTVRGRPSALTDADAAGTVRVAGRLHVAVQVGLDGTDVAGGLGMGGGLAVEAVERLGAVRLRLGPHVELLAPAERRAASAAASNVCPGCGAVRPERGRPRLARPHKRQPALPGPRPQANIGSRWPPARPIPGGAPHRPHLPADHPAPRPTAATGCSGRPVTCGSGSWTATAIHASKATRPWSATRPLPPAHQQRRLRGAVGGRGPLGTSAVLRCLV
jgi:hypothetical protein